MSQVVSVIVSADAISSDYTQTMSQVVSVIVSEYPNIVENKYTPGDTSQQK